MMFHKVHGSVKRQILGNFVFPYSTVYLFAFSQWAHSGDVNDLRYIITSGMGYSHLTQGQKVNSGKQ